MPGENEIVSVELPSWDWLTLDFHAPYFYFSLESYDLKEALAIKN